MEPEVEGTLLVVSRNVAGVCLEQHLGVPRQHGAVDRLHLEHVRGGVIAGLTVDLQQ